jgi:DNA-binding NarL/FixJ family response regulator
MIVKILMIDDHQMIIEGYKSILSLNSLGYTIETTDVNNCESAYAIITNTSNLISYDIVFLDYSMPPYPEQNLFTGEDVAILIRKHLPNSKIILITAYLDSFKIHSIIKKTKPEGLIIKSDFQPQELLQAFEKIINGNTYYSKTITESLKESILTQGQLDRIDIQIITLISQGYKIKTIAEKMAISQDTVKKRKVKIKDVLGINKGNDEDIVIECRKLGYIFFL